MTPIVCVVAIACLVVICRGRRTPTIPLYFVDDSLTARRRRRRELLADLLIPPLIGLVLLAIGFGLLGR